MADSYNLKSYFVNHFFKKNEEEKARKCRITVAKILKES